MQSLEKGMHFKSGSMPNISFMKQMLLKFGQIGYLTEYRKCQLKALKPSLLVIRPSNTYTCVIGINSY